MRNGSNPKTGGEEVHLRLERTSKKERGRDIADALLLLVDRDPTGSGPSVDEMVRVKDE